MPTTEYDAQKTASRKVKINCGICGEDYSKSEKKGGFVFHLTMVCPDCAQDTYNDIRKLKATEFIRAVCPPDMTFKAFFSRVYTIDRINGRTPVDNAH
jgi:hypothetical protein